MELKLEKICNTILIFLSSVFLIFLTGISFLFSQRYGREEWGEIENGTPIYQISDNPFLHLAGLLLLFGLFTLFFYLRNKIKNKTIFICQLAVVLASGVLSFLILSGGVRTPINDQAQVYNAAMFFNNKNYISLTKGGYLDIYPQQLAFVAYIQLIFKIFGEGNFYAVQLLNCLWIMGFSFLYCLSLNELTDKKSIRLVGSFTLLFFLPLFLLSSWVYGDVPCLFFTMALYFSYLKYLKHRKKYLLAIMIFNMCLCLIFRKNSLITMIALLICLFFLWLHEKKTSLMITAVLLVVLPLGSIKMIEKYYETDSGYKIEGGLPSIMWIAMGISENSSKPGWFNNFSVPIYYSVNFDRDAAAEQAKERIRERVAIFLEDPVYGVSFYKRKICTQWNDPFYNTNSLLETDSESTGITRFLLQIRDTVLFSFLSVYQFLIYFGAMLYCIKFASKRQIHENFLIILFLGGMLFSILWEGNSRYVLPYAVMLLPLSIIGWERIFTHEPKSAENA